MLHWSRLPVGRSTTGIERDARGGAMTPAERAVAHVDALALAATPAARRRVAAALRQTPAAGADADMLGAGLFRRGRVAVHFHPDRNAAGRAADGPAPPPSA